MTDYIVCVPSYKHAETCNNKTLTMLKNNKINAAADLQSNTKKSRSGNNKTKKEIN